MTFYVRRFQFGTAFLAFPKTSVFSKSIIGIGKIKNNPQVYTTQEGMQEMKNNPQVRKRLKVILRYTPPKRARKIEFTLIYIRRPLFVWTLFFFFTEI